MTADEPPTFGVLLSRYRGAVGLTQEELAEQAGLSVEAIGALERGVRTRPRAVTVRRLAEALQLAPDDRATFEHAAHAAGAAAADVDTLPEGNFLGALPPASSSHARTTARASAPCSTPSRMAPGTSSS